MTPKQLRDAQGLIDEFQAMEPREQAAICRRLAQDESDPGRRTRLIMAALRYDALASLSEDTGPTWKDLAKTLPKNDTRPFVDDDDT